MGDKGVLYPATLNLLGLFAPAPILGPGFATVDTRPPGGSQVRAAET